MVIISLQFLYGFTSNIDGELYSGTVADFSASDSLIIKNVTSAKNWEDELTRLRTEQYDFKQLNGNDNSHFIHLVNCFIMMLGYYNSILIKFYVDISAPDFVSTIEDKDHVYFFFRESAVEYINCGKVR